MLAAIGLLAGLVYLLTPGPASHRHLRVGYDSAPPYTQTGANGRAEGLVVDVLNEAARRRGIVLDWVGAVQGAEPSLQKNLVELWALARPTPKWEREFHCTKPWLRNGFFLVAPARNPVPPSSRLKGKKLALVNGPVTRERAKHDFPDAIHLIATNRLEVMLRLCRGEADAALVEKRLLQSVLLGRPKPCAEFPLQVTRVRGSEIELGIGSTKASADVADMLRDEIERLRADGTVSRALDTWCPLLTNEAEVLFEEQEARRTRTIYLTILGLAAFGGIVVLWQYRNVNAARRLAEGASVAKSDFVASISHEIRTPLAGILSTAELLSGTGLSTEQAEYAGVISQSGQTLLALLNNVLDIKKIEAGKLELSVAPFHLTELLSQTLDTFRASANRKGLALSLDGLEAIPARVVGDGMRIREVLANLLGNAVKFTQAGSVSVHCTWTAGDPAGRLRVAVDDTGIGIPEGLEQNLFQKFTQADSSINKKYGGTGLGLALARELVRLMDGDIGCKSRPGAGAEFWFEVPLSLVPVDAGPAPCPAPAAVPVARSRDGQAAPWVLLVEDNAVNRLVATRFLARAGCHVDEASSGREALERVAARRYDAVFMDCFMPEMDGYEATRQIRARENGGPRTPVVALTAAAFTSDREKAAAAGMDDYLTKPLDRAELTRVLDRWVFAAHTPAKS
ncbi:MAG: ATP-binding protein [Acidobacteria bacterium]|nr:ATP-binding protein [Acidobacteriota bacterium]